MIFVNTDSQDLRVGVKQGYAIGAPIWQLPEFSLEGINSTHMVVWQGGGAPYGVPYLVAMVTREANIALETAKNPVFLMIFLSLKLPSDYLSSVHKCIFHIL